MIHTGYDAMAKQASKLKGGSKEQASALLEKARADLPAKPTKKAAPAKAAPAKAAAAAPASKPVVDVDMVDYDEPAERPSTAKAGGAKAKPKAGAAGKKVRNLILN